MVKSSENWVEFVITRPDLLWAWGDVEGALGLEALGDGLLHDGGHASHVLVGGVCAGADEAVLDLQGPPVGLGGLAKGPDGRGQVGSEGAVDVGLQGAQVDVNHLGDKKVLSLEFRTEAFFQA